MKCCAVFDGCIFRFHCRCLFLKSSKFNRLVIVHYRRLRGHFAFATLLLKLKPVNKSLVFGQKLGQKKE